METVNLRNSKSGGEIFYEILSFLEQTKHFLDMDLFGRSFEESEIIKLENERKELSDKSHFMLKLFNLARQEGAYVNMDSANNSNEIENISSADTNPEFEYTYCDFRDDNSSLLVVDSATCPYGSLTFSSLPASKLALHGELMISEKRLFHKAKLKTVHAVLIDNWMILYSNDNKKPIECVKVIDCKRCSDSDSLSQSHSFVVVSSITPRTKEHEFHVATEDEIENWIKALLVVARRFNNRHSYVNVTKTQRELPGIPESHGSNLRKSTKSDDIYEEPDEMSEAVYDVVDNTVPPPVLPEKKLSMQTFKTQPTSPTTSQSDYDVPKNNKPVSPSVSSSSFSDTKVKTPEISITNFDDEQEQSANPLEKYPNNRHATKALEVKTIELKMTEEEQNKPTRRRLFLDKSNENTSKHVPMEVKEISKPIQNHNEIKEKLLMKGIQLTPIKVAPEKGSSCKTSPIKDFNRHTIKSWFSTKWSKIDRKSGVGELSKDIGLKDTSKVNLIIHQLEVNKHLEQVLKIRNKRNTIVYDENE